MASLQVRDNNAAGDIVAPLSVALRSFGFTCHGINTFSLVDEVLWQFFATTASSRNHFNLLFLCIHSLSHLPLTGRILRQYDVGSSCRDRLLFLSSNASILPSRFVCSRYLRWRSLRCGNRYRFGGRSSNSFFRHGSRCRIHLEAMFRMQIMNLKNILF